MDIRHETILTVSGGIDLCIFYLDTAMPKNLSFGLFVAGLCFLCFALGASLAAFKAFPYGVVMNAYLGGKAACELLSRGGPNDRSTQVWHRARSAKRGVVRYDPQSALNGYTLYTSAHEQRAHLVAMDGRVVHEWQLGYDKVWDRSAQVKRPPAAKYIYWRKAGLFPNGDLLVIYVEAGMTPWGLGLVKMDRSSNIIWKYLRRVHHDFCLAHDGRIYTLTHEIREKPLPCTRAIKTPFVDDLLTVLSSEGKEMERYSLYDALCRSDFRLMLEHAPANEHGDYLHANAVEVLEADKAAAFPFARQGQILVSFREINFIGILDPASKSFVWGTTGPWLEQHDPDFLSGGTILLFDNRGRLGMPGGASRVIEFDPQTHAIVWCFEGAQGDEFYSEVRCAQQRLSNGNTLITESDPGRILEVTRDKRVVWEYVNPASRGEDGGLIPAVCWATRFAPDELDDGFRAALKE